MYLEDYLKQFDGKQIDMYVDVDGVLADYKLGEAKNYDTKRPLGDSIEKLEKVSKLPNVHTKIFSAARYNSGVPEKHAWFDKNLPFIKNEDRIIISREDNDMKDSSILKAEYLQNIERKGQVIVVIDDDPKNLFDIRDLNPDAILLKDTVLVDDTAVKLQAILDEFVKASFLIKINEENNFQKVEFDCDDKISKEHYKLLEKNLTEYLKNNKSTDVCQIIQDIENILCGLIITWCNIKIDKDNYEVDVCFDKNKSLVADYKVYNKGTTSVSYNDGNLNCNVSIENLDYNERERGITVKLNTVRALTKEIERVHSFIESRYLQEDVKTKIIEM